MTCKDRLETYLRQQQVPYQTQHHPIAYTAQEVAASEHIPGRMLAKVVMVVADGKLAMIVMPATYQVDLGETARALEAGTVRLAHEDEFAASFPECEVGAMPPFGNLFGLPVYVDRALTRDETIVFQAGTHTDTMSMKYADYERLVNPSVMDLARRAA